MTGYEIPQSDDSGTEARSRRDELEALHPYAGIEAILNDTFNEKGLNFGRGTASDTTVEETILGEEYAA